MNRLSLRQRLKVRRLSTFTLSAKCSKLLILMRGTFRTSLAAYELALGELGGFGVRNGGSYSSPVRGFRAALMALLAAFSFAASGCLTNFGATRSLSSGGGGGNDEVEQENPFAGGGANSALLTLSRVVKSATTPAAHLDLHGDGSGSFGNYCVSSGGGNSPTGPSTCSCNYSYIRPDGNSESFNTDTIYREDNMIRCDYSSVPAGVTQMRVRIHLTSVDAYSNEVVFRFSGGAGVISSTDTASFLRVQRYQCKQALYIPNPFDSRVIDPFMSEDSKFAFMGNFYTTNMGLALAHFADFNRQSGNFNSPGHTDAGWICPTTPNDSSFGADLTLYSVAPDGSGNFKLHPPSDPTTDRSTFYLAKQATGAFTVPFNSFSVPGEATQVSQGGQAQPGGPLPPMGYGAAPIRNTVDGEESCPGSDVAIPSGFKWVKVWAFRGTIVDRDYETSSNFSGIRGLACNPGLWDVRTTSGSLLKQPVFPACGSANQQLGNDFSASECTGESRTMPISSGTQIADRLIYPFTGDNTSVQCAKINPGGTTNSSNQLEPTYGALSLGSDTWRRYTKAYQDGDPGVLNSCQKHTLTGAPGSPAPVSTVVRPDDCAQAFNIFNLCPGTTIGSVDLLSNPTATTSPDVRPAPLSEADPDWSAPWATADGQTILTGTRYTDIVYVVTPTNIMTRHMMEESESGTGAQYRPFRFYSGGDCSSTNPFSPGLRADGTLDCPVSRRIHYEFVNRDPTQVDSTVGGVDPNQARGYPICALQPN
jgi:hypothetical protein